jgi:imidazolonepropionase-like amidohydrolase
VSGRYLVRGRQGFVGSGGLVGDLVIEVAGAKIGRVGRTADFGADDLSASLRYDEEFVMPGMIDAHTHLGIWRQGAGAVGDDLNETTELVQPHIRSIDSVDPRDSAFSAARAAGITAVAVSPGSLPLVGGQVCLLKTLPGHVDEMILREPIAVKASFGAASRTRYGGRGPVTRMGAAAAFRESLIAAGNYRLLRKERGDRVPRNLRLEMLCDLLDGAIPFHVHVHEAHTILTVLRLAHEFRVNVVIIHGTEAYQVADRLAAAEVPVVFGPTLMSQRTPELANLSFQSAEKLREAGVSVAVTTDHGEIPIDHLITCAALSAKHGMPQAAALAAVTSVPAGICGAGERIGRIATSYDADLALYDGDPLDLKSTARATIISGIPVSSYRRSER